MKVNIQLSSTSVKKEENRAVEDTEIIKLDKRLQRLQRLNDELESKPEKQNELFNQNRRRRGFEPEVIEEEPLELDKDEQNDDDVERRHNLIRERLLKEEEEEDELTIKKNLEQQQGQQSKKKESSEEESSEDEELSEEESDEDSEDEFFNLAPRIKPVFIRKEDRLSIINQRKEAEEKSKREEIRNRKAAEDRRKEALRIIESTVQKERLEKDQQTDANFESINSVKTDDESDEVAYLNWKIRELKRNRRDKEERESFERERQETEKLRNMTEEERLEELRRNPKKITNRLEKGKYKFMQKYYHRGAYFMDKEEDVLKRDVTKPTLEDHFDKTSLPKVMQVKNFGKSGQTKYTHLADQDTTDHNSPWYSSNDSQAAKIFYEKHGAGTKQVFERPSKKRKN